ncbi:MAG TPA: efflux RND transporter periplasmic adaptor subunit [Parvularculaceae bacterium]|nr:efflux RND transporter periplasmic adaptor subunit [Amphiplicatus sp.]HPE31383.1 efflux RND transporter periplasmic adaptor subunit [Parvularculaceae bacterium]
MQFSTSGKTALAILAAFILYFGVRTVLTGKEAEAPERAADEIFTVVATPIASKPWRDEVVIRGRTQALRKVIVRAEIPGVVAETPVTPGTLVEEGATLCRLKIDARAAALNEAKASLEKAELDFRAAEKLAEEGFRAETGVAAAKAALDLARANHEQAMLAVAKTKISAPFDGVFDDQIAEVGDFLAIGDPCGVIIQQSPFLVVGAVSERDVAKIKAGDRGVARLSTGEEIEGSVRSVATASDEATRTFEVQLEVANSDGKLRDGVTAEFTVFADRRDAHLVPRSALTLDDEGHVGVRLVDSSDIVGFNAVTILGESTDGVWIAGLDGDVRVITRGQDFVRRGQKVAVSEESAPS